MPRNRASIVMKDAGKYAFELLSLTSAAADAFPPLKSAAGGALYIAQAVKVSALLLLLTSFTYLMI